MGRRHTRRARTAWIPAAVVAALAVSGCAGIEPYEPRNQREEGPERGLFTEAATQFVILREADESSEGSAHKGSQEAAEGAAQPRLGGN